MPPNPTFPTVSKRLRRGRMAAISLAVAGIVAIGLGPSGSATQPTGPDAKPANDPTKQFFEKHCQACHTGAKAKGDFQLKSLSQDFADRENRLMWLSVLEQVKSGNMPPPEKPRPAENDIKRFADWINARAGAAESDRNAVQGRVVLRRLNRSEYANTIRDLLAVEVDLRDLLPVDTSAGGFDNNAEALHTSSYLMENYLEAADRVLDAAIASGPKPTTLKRRFDLKAEQTVKAKGSVYRHVDDGVAIFSSWVSANIQVTLWQFNTRERGRYRFRIAGHGIQTEKPVLFHVMAGPLNSAAEQYLVGYFDVPAETAKVVEFVEPMEPLQTIRIIVDGLGAIPPQVEKVGAENYKGPGLVVQWVEIEGPLVESWPPKSHRLIFGDLKQEQSASDRNRREVVSPEPLADAVRILRSFTRRAFRRAVTDDDIKPFLARVRSKLEQNDSFEQALRVGLRAVLVSPDFLFLREKILPSEMPAPDGDATKVARRMALDDFALASRLSYFLWSSMPDDELLALAGEGKLSRPETLRGQVERMLGDPKAAAFTENFAGQWLSLRAIDSTQPDPTLYPEYDDVLRISMLKEAYGFFDEVLKKNLSLTNFVASDFAMLNDRLARHYGIPGVEGLDIRKVDLPPGSHRGGVLTMASVLKVTANGTTTSPIIRGAWVLDRILGTPPPKPTVDVEAVEPDIRGSTTIRNQLEKHRNNPACATCHVTIDPPGFALESFDVIGGWRERYRSVGDGEAVPGRRYKNGPAVDAGDTLPDGRKFANIDEFKSRLLENKDQLARALADKLLTYATGASPTIADRPKLDTIVGKVREKKYGFRELIHEIVQSEVFQSK